jgi:cellulose biosynthesis protein BcsQ
MRSTAADLPRNQSWRASQSRPLGEGKSVSDVSAFFEKLHVLIRHEQLWGPLAVVLPVMAAAGFWFGRYFPRHPQSPPSLGAPVDGPRSTPIRELEDEIRRLKSELAIGPESIQRARNAVSPIGPGLWLAIDPCPPLNYRDIRSSIPIYTVANLKGGVGKTTIATGLAAHFANPFGTQGRRRERVLLLDLDFQGSLSSMALTTADRIPQNRNISRATELISGDCDGTALIGMHQRVKGLDNLPNGHLVELYAIPAYYDLAQAENRLLVEWLVGDGTRDIRYHLAELLLSDEVQRRYDRIIIDAPPRLTTAHVQALSASTHVLIPTVLDQLSGEAVGSFVEQLITHAKLWPYLKIIGVVGSMTEWGQDKALQDHEKEGIRAIQIALDQKRDAHALRGPATAVLPRPSFIPDITKLARAAGTRIGYLDANASADALRQNFDSLGAAVLGALKELPELKDLVRS